MARRQDTALPQQSREVGRGHQDTGETDDIIEDFHAPLGQLAGLHQLAEGIGTHRLLEGL